MKAKERYGATTLTAPPGANGNHADSPSLRAAPPAWVEWFRHATTAQQSEALALAHRQGYVLAHQLPAVLNGVKASSPATVNDGLDVLRSLLAGKTEGLPSAGGAADDFGDATLSAAQKRAVRRVLGAPDITLLRGKAGVVTPVVAEAILQAARAGQRVLLLTHQAGALDQVLLRLHGRDAVLPVRFLDVGESAAQLPQPVRVFTLEAQRQLFQTQTLARAHASRIAAEECCQRRRVEETYWPQLTALAERHGVFEEKRRDLMSRFEQAPEVVQREADGIPHTGNLTASGPFASQVVEFATEFERQREDRNRLASDFKEKQSHLHVELAQHRTDTNVLQPLLDAKRAGRWWTLHWWRATFTKDLSTQADDMAARGATIQAGLDAVHKEIEQLADLERHAAERLAQDRVALIAAETERRRREWSAQIAEVDRELQPLLGEWQALCGKLEADHVPGAPTAAEISAAQTRWHACQERDEAACLFARQWAGFLQEAAPHFVTQLPRYASLVAGAVSALTRNPDFAVAAEGPFDLIILDDADRLLENDLLRLARKGRRWLLVSGATTGGNGRPCTFDKLWQTLHTDPTARLAYRWCKESDRWCCHLRTVAPSDRRYLETERLADFPEIELRIAALPKARPHLAQVVFPAAMSLTQAKQFIYRELQEAALQPTGRSAWLEDGAGSWTLHLGPSVPSELTAIDLEPGLRDWAAPHGATQRLEFDKSLWQQNQVEDWIRRLLSFRDLGRTFDLG